MTFEENEIQKLNAICDEYRKQIYKLEDEKECLKQENRYWYGQANRNYEDCHNGWTEQITKKVVKEILHDLHVRVCQSAMIQKEGTDGELHFLPTKAITDFIDCMKSHYEVEVNQ